MIMSEVPTNPEPPENEEPEISLQAFFQDIPPNQACQISGAFESPSGQWKLVKPDLTLFCPDELCGRGQTFTCTDRQSFLLQERDYILHYTCRNCERTTKKFAISVVEFSGRSSGDARLVKLGEEPAFGPPLPARLQRLVQHDRDLLVKG
jgi:hypothetical protein